VPAVRRKTIIVVATKTPILSVESANRKHQGNFNIFKPALLWHVTTSSRSAGQQKELVLFC
jgi:hypothetical protein